MVMMAGALFKALLAAHVSDEQAQAAAAEVAGFENRLAKLEADVALLKRMVAFNLMLSLANLAITMTIFIGLHH